VYALPRKVRQHDEEYSIFHSLEDFFQDIEGYLDWILESPIGESFHPLFEGGGEEPLETPLNTLNSHQQNPHNSHPDSPRNMG
jgi:hypothetical protein